MSFKFAITDVHGELELLEALIAQCRAFTNHPQFIFLGDYVDRGPDSAGVVRLVRKLVEEEDAIALMGNHDYMMALALLHGDSGDWCYNGMRTCAASYGYGKSSASDGQVLAEMTMYENSEIMDDARWLGSRPYSHEDDLRFYVHAGVDPLYDLNDQNPYDMIWIRRPFLTFQGQFPKHIVHGHTPHVGLPHATDITHRSNRTNLDTGAFQTGKLTAGVFDDTQPGAIAYLTATRP